MKRKHCQFFAFTVLSCLITAIGYMYINNLWSYFASMSHMAQMCVSKNDVQNVTVNAMQQQTTTDSRSEQLPPINGMHYSPVDTAQHSPVDTVHQSTTNGGQHSTTDDGQHTTPNATQHSPTETMQNRLCTCFETIGFQIINCTLKIKLSF